MREKNLNKGSVSEKNQNQIIFFLILVAGIILVSIIFNIIAAGRFLETTNILVIISHIVWPTFVAWGLCFLFACGYTDLSIGAILVLGSFATCIFGNRMGYPGVILGGLITGTLLVFINFYVFAFTKIPSWIAGISLAMIYEAVAVFLKVNKSTSDLIYAEMDRNQRKLGVMPWSMLLLAAGFVIAYIIYNRTTIGLNIRAIGGNKEVAKALGINIMSTLMWVGIICGLFIGFASIVQESVAGRTTVKTGLTSIYVVFQPLARVLLHRYCRKSERIIAVPVWAIIFYGRIQSSDNTGRNPPDLQEALLGAFLIAFALRAAHIKGGEKAL
jgi:ribose transport system permease protein